MRRVTMEVQARLARVYVVSQGVGFGLLLLMALLGIAGIPTIIKPFFGDQFFWSDRVEALGIGSSVRKLTVEHLTAALRTATTDVKQIEKAKLVGQSIRSVSLGHLA
jgi:UDP:flavonoid glycosyltransferase YjiC (YdhE family)